MDNFIKIDEYLNDSLMLTFDTNTGSMVTSEDAMKIIGDEKLVIRDGEKKGFS